MRRILLGVLASGLLFHCAAGEARAELSHVFRVSEGARLSMREAKEAVPSEGLSRVEADFS